MDNIVWNIIGGIGLSGLFVAFLNIRQALFLGMGVGWLSLCAMFVLSLPSLRDTPTIWAFIAELFSVLGNIVALLALIGFYTLYCVYGNKDHIANGTMPDTWYLFSYFVVSAFALNLIAIVSYLKENNPGYKALSLLLSTLTMGFILIETIICSYFQTDGFLV
jgi:hypothetical protein